MANIDKTYEDYLENILRFGYNYEDPNRKGVFRRELTKVELRHELDKGFPILTTKKTFFNGAVAELLFFLSGSTDIRDLWKRKVNFWDKDWARYQNLDEGQTKVLKNHYRQNRSLYGDRYNMGRIYPAQYRDWTNFVGNDGNALFYKNIDQFANVVKTLWENPMSTSMIVNAWNPAELDRMALPPCHYGFQIVGRPLSLEEREKIYIIKIGWAKEDTYRMDSLTEHFDKADIPKYGFEVHWQQRSTDYFLGTPINIQYYALLAHLLEYITGHKALAVQGDLKNVHLYDNQFDQARELVDRDVTKYTESTLMVSDYLRRVKTEGHYDGTNLDEILEGLKVDDFQLDEYEHYPALKAEMLTYNK